MTRRVRSAGILSLAAAVFIAFTAAVSAHDRANGAQESAVAPTDGGQSVQPLEGPRSGLHQHFTDVELIDQEGRARRFYSDLLRDKVVVVSTFFTNCKEYCPIAADKLLQLQDLLGERLGKDVHFLSLTVDPETDKPAKLLEFAQKVKAKPGWHFLTGDPANLAIARGKLFTPVATGDHSTLILLIDGRNGRWTAVDPYKSAADMAEKIDLWLSDRTR